MSKLIWYFTNYAICPWLSLTITVIYLAIPPISLAIPAISLAIPAPSLSISALSLAVPVIPCCPGVILGYTPGGQEDSVAALCCLNLTMFDAGAKLKIAGIKQGFGLINMTAM